MSDFCQFPTCDNEATTEVLVSYTESKVYRRPCCESCAEVYASGVQHGQMRAVRQLQKLLEQPGFAPDVRRTLESALDLVREFDDPAEAETIPAERHRESAPFR